MQLFTFIRQWLSRHFSTDAIQGESSAPLAALRLKREVAGLNQVHVGPKGGLYRLNGSGHKVYLKKADKVPA
jgi:hypothetical protein